MKYILRKLLTLIITLFIVSLLAFLAFQVIPGSPATSMLGTNATPEKVAQLEEEMGLDDPVLVRYGRWVADFVQGDWGESYSYNLPVKDMVLEKLPATAALVLLAFAITVAASFPLGIATARREGSRLDRIITVGNQICMSIPPVFVGILLCFVFGSPCGCLYWKFCVLCRQPGAIFPLHALPGPGGGPVPDGDDR
ncbi:MAG: ABC transporter permease [Evtepia gabavorous]